MVVAAVAGEGLWTHIRVKAQINIIICIQVMQLNKHERILK